MMSESDDTDVLLLIPPDLFLVPSSSESDICSHREKTDRKSGVISELVEHMQSLETRISAIEFKDVSLDATLLNNSLDTQIQSNVGFKQMLPKTRFCVSQDSSLQNTPIKPRKSLSVPSTPNGHFLSCINFGQNEARSEDLLTGTNATNANDNDMNKHDLLTSHSDSSVVVPSQNVGFSHATSCKGELCSCPVDCRRNTSNMYIKPNQLHSMPSTSNLLSTSEEPNSYSKTSVQEMELSEVDELLQEMKATEQELTKRINRVPIHQYLKEQNSSQKYSVGRKLEFEQQDLKQYHNAFSIASQKKCSDIFPDISLPYNTSFPLDETDKLISEFTTWEQSVQKTPLKTGDLEGTNFKTTDTGDKSIAKENGVKRKVSVTEQPPINAEDDVNSISAISIHNVQTQNKNLDSMLHSELTKYSNAMSAKSSDYNKLSLPETARFINNTEHNTLHSSQIAKAIPESEHTTLYLPETARLTNNSEYSIVHLSEIPKSIRNLEYSTLYPSETTKSINGSQYTVPHLPETYKMSQQNGNVQHLKQTHDVPHVKCVTHASTNTEFLPRKSQRLLSLSDFWDNSSNKTQEEMRRIKLEEEKFRREHCEHLIQELQKRLLEQQEKVAVALRVDNEKNELITQFHAAWSKLKQRVHMLENEYTSLQTNLQNVTEKHQLEISEFQSQIKRCEGELSKALDLAAGYKEKSDVVIKEKVELLKSHADELENYKSFVQEAENRCDHLKVEYNKLLEKNQQTEETLKSLQQELGRERLKGGEVRNEMNVIHKALDTCEAELIVLRQEKENLQLKLKEEMNRNAILEQKNDAVLSAMDDAKTAEKLAKDEAKSLSEQKEKVRLELQEVYQKQVDEVVKVKLQEFQTQLDAAESEFLEELKTRQQVIAECAARKIKDIMDKHRLEINLIEEKNKEEKRLCELQLAQVLQKSVILETQLNSQRATKSQLAEQLHSVMQKQWQQALQIISGGNMENLTPLQKINAEKLFDFKSPRKSESMPNFYTQLNQEPIRLTAQTSEAKNFHHQNESMSSVTPIEDTPLTSRKESRDDLRRYVRMIAELQQSREDYARVRESIASPPLICRTVPRKHYLKKELSIKNEDSVSWQPASDATTPDTSEFLPISQKVCAKGEQKTKPPWK